MSLAAGVRVRRLADGEAGVPALGAVLYDCVDGGASVGFMAGFTLAEAEAFWSGQLAAGDGRAILVAEDEAGICEVVQMIPAGMPNQPHRADIAKMLVHRRARRRGVAEGLLRAAEAAALQAGRWLLVLDAVSDGDAARLYRRAGWIEAGPIPDYALMPDGALCSTTYFYKRLR